MARRAAARPPARARFDARVGARVIAGAVDLRGGDPMSALGLLVVVAVVVAVAVLGALFAVDTRPTAADPPQVWLRHRS